MSESTRSVYQRKLCRWLQYGPTVDPNTSLDSSLVEPHVDVPVRSPNNIPTSPIHNPSSNSVENGRLPAAAKNPDIVATMDTTAMAMHPETPIKKSLQDTVACSLKNPGDKLSSDTAAMHGKLEDFLPSARVSKSDSLPAQVN